MARPDVLRVAVAQTEVSDEVPNAGVLAAAGARVRSQMAEAAAVGARVVQFPEGTLTYPSKRLISRRWPEIGEADWAKVDWDALQEELQCVAMAAADLGIWTVVGAPHLLSNGRRPHNSLYVFSDRGELVTRYDKRRLSITEVTYMYTAGTEAVVFVVDDFRLGTVLCLEILFPELFIDYAAMGVDAVLVSSAPSPTFGLLAQAHAIMNAVPVALAFAASGGSEVARSGICAAEGWLSRCDDGLPGLAIADIARQTQVTFHRKARAGLYDAHLAPSDPRSLDRRSL
ncbi:MAG: hypothetical protein AVDCRST_MAG10-2394 [uncultured Acidimicrobiales bacterium]|uniref:CN hydrolase domain-containing protein n=1 Tax=uncultured Acidimicrobiales bacterium TaxID=310071 RepID=A0A6J4ILU7_9ACTN|nr:MAG: hypothetical protein AVDCRST_MAG10-2394 [uncultured Acidimicrobiales bacterium]